MSDCDDKISISKTELKNIVKEVLDEEFKTCLIDQIKSKESRDAFSEVWRSIVINYIGESILSKLSFAIWLFSAAFVYWIVDSGFVQWLKSKGFL